jgi:hypothetical protein
MMEWWRNKRQKYVASLKDKEKGLRTGKIKE